MISIDIADLIAGLDEDEIYITFEGSPVRYSSGSAGFSFDGSRLDFNPSAAGLPAWSGGDTVRVTVSASDNIDYCDSNYASYEWCFIIPAGGPIPTIVTPGDSTISACIDNEILIAIFDVEGVDTASVILNVNGVDYSLADDELTFINDTLRFNPPAGYYQNNDTIFVVLTSLRDIFGNISEELPLEWSFLIDLEGPDFVDIQPAPATVIRSDWQREIRLGIFDNLLGVDPDSVRITIDGIYRAPIFAADISDLGLTFANDTLIFTPSLVDDIGLVSYDLFEDSLTGTGLYFPEFADINVHLTAWDNLPDYCASNRSDTSFTFTIADDDTTAPVIALLEPAFIDITRAFDVVVSITDSSGVMDYDTFGVWLLWDTDGEVNIDNYRVEMAYESGSIVYNPDGTVSLTYSTVAPIGPIVAPQSGQFVCELFAYDGDFDFMNHNDPLLGSLFSRLNILYAPIDSMVTPQGGDFTGCLDQEIVIFLYDTEGIDESSIVLHLDSMVYTIDHQWLSYSVFDSLLRFTPDVEIFANNDHITGFLEPVADIYGNSGDTLFFDFYVDNEPPVISIIAPEEGEAANSSTEEIRVFISDNLAGIKLDTLTFIVNDQVYVYPSEQVSWEPYDSLSGSFVFDMSGDLSYIIGDTIYVEVYAEDALDIRDCGINSSTVDWWFLLELAECKRFPNPFTPNRDGYNDEVIFDYPRMFSSDAELKILDKRNQLIYEKKLSSIVSYSDYESRLWDGKDRSGNAADPGLYIYMILRDGEVLCNGTILLVR